MKYRIGVDLGGTNIAVGIVDEAWRIVSAVSVPTRAERGEDSIIKDIAAAVKTAQKQKNISLSDCVAVGVGCPGTCDEQNGIISYASNLRWVNVPVAEKLRALLELPVKISNDANCAALGEVKAGAAKNCRNAIMLTLGTGVGGGIIWDGKIFSGGYSCGTEIGHMMLIENGEPCSCGRRGCIEAYASATALIRDTRREMERSPQSLLHKIAEEQGEVNGKTAFDAAQKGDAAAQRVIDAYIVHLANAAVDLINVFRPDVFILGGGVAAQGEYLLEPVRKFAKKYCYGGTIHPLPQFVCAKLGNDAGIIGAAGLS